MASVGGGNQVTWRVGSRLCMAADLDEALGDDADDLADALGHVVHRELDRVLPHGLEHIMLLAAHRGDGEIRIDGLCELAPLLEGARLVRVRGEG